MNYFGHDNDGDVCIYDEDKVTVHTTSVLFHHILTDGFDEEAYSWEYFDDEELQTVEVRTCLLPVEFMG